MRNLFQAMALTGLLAIPATAQDASHIRVAQGELAGIKDRGADAYLNIPFAAPPVGAARWTASGAAAGLAGRAGCARIRPRLHAAGRAARRALVHRIFCRPAL